MKSTLLFALRKVSILTLLITFLFTITAFASGSQFLKPDGFEQKRLMYLQALNNSREKLSDTSGNFMSKVSDGNGTKMLYFLDGKSVSEEIVLGLKRRDVFKSYVLTDNSLLKKYNTKEAVYIITMKNKDSESVNNFATQITDHVENKPAKTIMAQTLPKSAIKKNMATSIISIDTKNHAHGKAIIVSKYIIDPTRYDSDEFGRISDKLSEQGFTLKSSPTYILGKLAKLEITLKSGQDIQTKSWEADSGKEDSKFLVETDSGTGKVLLKVLTK